MVAPVSEPHETSAPRRGQLALNRKESWRQGPHRGRQLSDSGVHDVPERLTGFEATELVRDVGGVRVFIRLAPVHRGGMVQNVGGVLSQASSLARAIPDSYYRSVY